MKIRYYVLVFLCLLLGLGNSYADTFHYNIIFTGDTFQFDVPELITTDTIIQSSDFTSNSPVFTSLELDPVECWSGAPVACIWKNTLMVQSGVGLPRFDHVGFITDDTYVSIEITQISDAPSPVPETRTIGFVGIGLLGLTILPGWTQRSRSLIAP